MVFSGHKIKGDFHFLDIYLEPFFFIKKKDLYSEKTIFTFKAYFLLHIKNICY